eukprot:537329-Lingulodinium_polyedra.AAC.1
MGARACSTGWISIQCAVSTGASCAVAAQRLLACCGSQPAAGLGLRRGALKRATAAQQGACAAVPR